MFSKHWQHIETTFMKLNLSFFHKRDKLLEKYNGTWEKVRDSLKNEFHSEPVYNQKCLKGKTKS